MTRTLLLIAIVAATVSAGVVLEPGTSRQEGTKNWQRVRKSKSNEIVNVMIMMKHTPSQLEELETAFFAVSDPKNEKYGEHFNQADVTELMAHPKVDDVVAWLQSGGAKRVDVGVHRDIVEADLPVEVAEKMLSTKFHLFQHSLREDIQLHRAVSDYSVPEHIAPLIKFVGNVVRFPAVRSPILSSGPSSAPSNGNWVEDCKSCGNGKVTPGVIAKRYSLPASTGLGGTANGSFAVAEFQGQAWDQKDVEKFSSSCNLKNFTVTHPVNAPQSKGCQIPIIGTQLCGEALLDIEYALAVSGGDIPLSDIYLAQFSLLNWAKQVSDMSDKDVPLIHSVSYGNDEAQQTGVPYMESVNTEFQKLGVRGISILFASGDQGVLGREGGGARFHPDFPAGSPYVTAVGGTDFATASEIGDEKAWVDGGGGFSDTFPIPSYQQEAVEGYIKNTKGLPPQSYWNNTGRGYPDISALAGTQNPYCIGVGSILMGIAGTSAACPTAAAVFARLNEVRLASGGKPMGFLNPWIYQNSDAFNDVTQGNNGAGGAHGGFPAVKNWDASTGVGTPNYAAMVKKL